MFFPIIISVLLPPPPFIDLRITSSVVLFRRITHCATHNSQRHLRELRLERYFDTPHKFREKALHTFASAIFSAIPRQNVAEKRFCHRHQVADFCVSSIACGAEKVFCPLNHQFAACFLVKRRKYGNNSPPEASPTCSAEAGRVLEVEQHSPLGCFGNVRPCIHVRRACVRHSTPAARTVYAPSSTVHLAYSYNRTSSMCVLYSHPS